MSKLIKVSDAAHASLLRMSETEGRTMTKIVDRLVLQPELASQPLPPTNRRERARRATEEQTKRRIGERLAAKKRRPVRPRKLAPSTAQADVAAMDHPTDGHAMKATTDVDTCRTCGHMRRQHDPKRCYVAGCNCGAFSETRA